MRTTYLKCLPLTLLFLVIEAVPALRGQALSDHAETIQLNQVSSYSTLPNGVDLQDGDARMQIVALRQDVIRIRVSRDKNLSEDASWAVLEAARQSRVSVTAIETADAVGFQTQVLRVSISRSKFALTVSDREGNILQQDALPIEFRGSSFRVYKEMPFDEHYFGLGDKPGPLDRRDQAFTLWNTDAYGFQESTDPIYKSIPYFMTFRSGHAVGIFVDNTWRNSFDFGKQLPHIYSFGAVNGAIRLLLIIWAYTKASRRDLRMANWDNTASPYLESRLSTVQI